MHTRSVALETRLGLREAADVVAAAFGRMKARVEPVPVSPDPLDRVDGVADFAVVGRRSTIVSSWAVQVYLYDLGDRRGVELVAVGRTAGAASVPRALTRPLDGVRHRASLTKSQRQLDSLVDDLRSRDASAQVIG